MKKDIRLMRISIILLLISSFSVLLVMFASFDGNTFQKILAYLTGATFWLFLIIGYVVFYQVSKHRKKYEIKNPAPPYRKGQKRPGILTFFSDRVAMSMDIIMIISLILSLLFLFIPSLNQNIAIVFIAILIFSIHMHSILNGVNYKYTLHLSCSLSSNKGE